MQNTMRAHSAGQISIEGGVDVNKGHMVYSHVLFMSTRMSTETFTQVRVQI